MKPETMSTKFDNLVRSIFSKSKYTDSRTPEEKYKEYLDKQISIEEEIAQQKIKLQLLRKIDSDKIDELLNGTDGLDELVSSIVMAEVIEKIKNQAKHIAREALDDIEDNYKIKSAIRLSTVNMIRKAFGQPEIDHL